MAACMLGKLHYPVINLHVVVPFGLESRMTLKCLHTTPFCSTLGGDVVKDEVQKCHSTEGTARKLVLVCQKYLIQFLLQTT